MGFFSCSFVAICAPFPPSADIERDIYVDSVRADQSATNEEPIIHHASFMRIADKLRADISQFSI